MRTFIFYFLFRRFLRFFHYPVSGYNQGLYSRIPKGKQAITYPIKKRPELPYIGVIQLLKKFLIFPALHFKKIISYFLLRLFGKEDTNALASSMNATLILRTLIGFKLLRCKDTS